MVPGKHCDFSTNLAKRARAQSGACAEVQFPYYGTVLWSPGSRNGSKNTAISAPNLPRKGMLILVHAQRCSFLIMEQSCVPLAIEFIPGNHCNFSTYFEKSARAYFGSCAELQFPDYGTELWSPGSRNFSRISLRLQHLS
jgi:hypothetical protein